MLTETVRSLVRTLTIALIIAATSGCIPTVAAVTAFAVAAELATNDDDETSERRQDTSSDERIEDVVTDDGDDDETDTGNDVDDDESNDDGSDVGDVDDGQPAPPPPSFTEVLSAALGLPQYLYCHVEGEGTLHIALTPDGTMAMSLAGYEDSVGSWSQEGETLRLVADGIDAVFNVGYVLDGHILTAQAGDLACGIGNVDADHAADFTTLECESFNGVALDEYVFTFHGDGSVERFWETFVVTTVVGTSWGGYFAPSTGEDLLVVVLPFVDDENHFVTFIDFAAGKLYDVNGSELADCN